MSNLTLDGVRNMKVSMSIIKFIKENYGMPTSAYATTFAGSELDVIYLTGMSYSTSVINNGVDHLRGPELNSANYDYCEINVTERKPVLDALDILPLFKEV